MTSVLATNVLNGKLQTTIVTSLTLFHTYCEYQWCWI